MPRLTSVQFNNAIGRLQTGATQQAEARHFGISRQTICASWSMYKTTQSVNDRPRPGHHRVNTTTQAERPLWCQQRVKWTRDHRHHGNVMLQKVFRCGIHHGGRTVLVYVVGALMGISYRDNLLQHHVILHVNFNGKP